MASTLLRRQLTSTPRSLTYIRRDLSYARPLFKNALDRHGHTVEDLQGMSASEILAETGQSRADTKMRHFTGERDGFLSSLGSLIGRVFWG